MRKFHPSQATPKVFVVDDDAFVRDSLKLLLEVSGLDVEDYESTADFAAHYTKPACGCLILDQHLPITTGLDFLNSPMGRNLGIPVILITGRGDASLRTRALQAGATHYLEKPVDSDALVGTLRHILHQDG